MFGIKKISQMNKEFFVNDNKLWEKITKEKKMIYDNTTVSLEEGIFKIYVAENTVFQALEMYSKILEGKILEYVPDLKKIEIIKVNKLNKQNKKEIKVVSSEDIEKNKRIKIYEDICKKYANVEDKDKKRMLIALESQEKIKEYLDKRENKKACITCKINFKPIKNERICVVCRNKEFKKKLIYIMKKIHKDPLITEEYAKKIYGIDENMYFQALGSIEDEMMQQIYNKIKLYVDENINIIDLYQELEEFSKYNLRTDDVEMIEKNIEKIKGKLKYNIEKIFNVKVEIK